MAAYETNFYYNPQESGLETLHTVERDESYAFDILAIWRRLSDGALFWMTDSGCSCPSPFEDYTFISDLNELTEATFPDFVVELQAYSDEIAIDEIVHDIQRRLGIFPGVLAVGGN